MSEIVVVTLDNIHKTVCDYVKEKEIKVENYDSMVDVYIKMVKDGYGFVVELEIVKTILIDLAYKLCPNDEFNRALVMHTLNIMEDDSDSDDEEENDKEN